MTKAEIIAQLEELGVEFDSTAAKAELEALLPVNEEQNGVQQEEGRDEEEVEGADVEDNTPEEVETVRVYDKRRRLMRTFTGKGARKQAEALASQPRRDGWTVV